MPKAQTQHPLPHDAPARLLAVRSSAPTLDEATEPEFDAMARVAAQLAGAPMAFVALIDVQRVRFQGCSGIDGLELERDVALRALGGDAEDGIVVIADLRDDARMCRSRLVVAPPALRFYAGIAVTDATGTALGAVGVLDIQQRGLDSAQRNALRDIACVMRATLQSRRRAAELARQVMLDPLTGAASRGQFDQSLEVELHHSMRTGEPFTLLRLSLDGVADIRNGFGSAAADAALREVAARMTRQVRLGDVLARLAGEEFGVVMRHGAATEAEVLAGRIVDAVRQPLTLPGGDVVGLRACIGMAAYDDGVASVAALLDHAEQALAAARRQHERRWNFFGRKFEAPALRLVAADADPSAKGGPADR